MKYLYVLLIWATVTLLPSRLHSQTPSFNSYATAPEVVLLDFDGHYVSGSTWNGGGSFMCEGSGLTTEQITEVFNRVAEDYRPFALNITTDAVKYDAAPANCRMRVIVTVTSSWYSSTAGGVSLVNSFRWGDDTPCFVFSALLGFNTKKIGEAVSHEAGHTLGLYHQSVYDANCGIVNQYNYGTGTGETSWAPIMGVGYDRNLTLWHYGPNQFGCQSFQDDLDKLTTLNGFSYRPDDHAGEFPVATTVAFSNSRFTINGIVEQPNDIDVIRFTMPVYGRLHLQAIPYNVGSGNAGSDLDMQVTLYNSSHTIIKTYNPPTTLDAILDSNLIAGDYYIKIEGSGNEFAPDYASLGSYSLQASFSLAAPLPLHRLELRGNNTGDRHRLTWEIVADEQVSTQALEVSGDGIRFTSLMQAAFDARSFNYQPYIPGNLFYRLNLVLDNGRQYYSNIVRLTGARLQKPVLIGNLIESSNLSISSPGNYHYSIYDAGGSRRAEGKLGQGLNTVAVNSLSAGIYVIRFEDNDYVSVEKFVKK
jgi:hypothetical protein